MAPQLMATNGSSRRGDSAWMVRAITSFPEPDSPVISTLAGVGATLWTRSSSRSILGERASGGR